MASGSSNSTPLFLALVRLLHDRLHSSAYLRVSFARLRVQRQLTARIRSPLPQSLETHSRQYPDNRRTSAPGSDVTDATGHGILNLVRSSGRFLESTVFAHRQSVTQAERPAQRTSVRTDFVFEAPSRFQSQWRDWIDSRNLRPQTPQRRRLRLTRAVDSVRERQIATS